MSILPYQIKKQKKGQFDVLYKYLSSLIPEKNEIISFKKAYEVASFSINSLKISPIDVACVVADEIGMGLESLLSSLLYNYSSNSNIINNDIETNFDLKILAIVKGINKINEKSGKTRLQNVNDLRCIYIEFINDIRIILIKIAIQVIEMRKLSKKTISERSKKSLETKYIFLPIIDRLGLTDLKSEMEDLCFKYLYPNIFYSIAKKLRFKKSDREFFLNKFIFPIKVKLEESNFKFYIIKRVKSITSIWHKVQRRGIPFDEIYDSIALRIVLEESTGTIKEREACWEVYNIISSIYTIKEERTRDWLSYPKENGYEALHMTVLSSEGHWGEIQIRSKRMNNLAENGNAVHWKYKGGAVIPDIPEIDGWLNDIKVIIGRNQMPSVEVLHKNKLKLYDNHICIFILGGGPLKIPVDSTILDLGFYINKENAIRCIGGKINNRVVSINHKLKNGDCASIFFGNTYQASEKWLNIVKTDKARNLINKILEINKDKVKIGY